MAAVADFTEAVAAGFMAAAWAAVSTAVDLAVVDVPPLAAVCDRMVGPPAAIAAAVSAERIAAEPASAEPAAADSADDRFQA